MARDTLTISQTVRDYLARAGVTLPPIPAELDTAAYFGLWRAVEAQGVDPTLGFELGGPAIGYSLGTEAALQAATLGDAFRTIGRYKRLHCPEEVVVAVHGAEAEIRCDWILASEDVPAMLVDAIFTSYVRLAAQATGGKATPLRIELARKRRHAEILRAHFRCPIRFGATHDRIVFAASALALPLVTANREAYARLVPGLEAQLARRRSVVGEVRVAIARTISAGGRPHVEAIADRLDTTPRTLQRKLGEARTTFQVQLDDVRRVAARRLLAHTELPPIDIAFLLGFAEPNSFARAFRHWERTTPLRWRAARS